MSTQGIRGCNLYGHACTSINTRKRENFVLRRAKSYILRDRRKWSNL